jgi:hypothetical protein
VLTLFEEIEVAVGGAVTVCWGAISAFQLLRAKLQAPKCVLCDRFVDHNGQSPSLAVPCHERCLFRAEAVVEYLSRLRSRISSKEF